ncbi:MAG: AmmeMemoRadiSam system protein B [Planctomycetes bacterium]|nr:AmmeMemoRadiSam system protein B [Planctomycetota bacterium]MCK5473229.1 AmmeMemoRadiSam system protein B [Planctomycetota bacterium]
MPIRKPIVAGQFYPAEKDLCIEQIEEFLQLVAIDENLPKEISAGIVPHAGWSFSGDLAAMVFAAIKKRCEKVDTFIIFGAVHNYFGKMPAVYCSGFWQTPLGQIGIDENLAKQILKSSDAINDISAHSYEHSIEVQIPFIQYLFPKAKIVPILTSPNQQAIKLGEAVGKIISAISPKEKIVCIGSTDLTHYGPGYNFTPVGVGQKANRWASEVNDKLFIDLTLELKAEEMLTSAAQNYNACGAGAAAATVAAVKKSGKTKGFLLAQTNSSEIMLQKTGRTATESVGYAAIVF